MNSKKTLVSSGVPRLDQLLGGLFLGDNVVWYDDSGSQATLFSLKLVEASQQQGKPLIYVSFDRSPKNLLDLLGPLAKSRHLTILDCFTHGKGDGSQVFGKFYEKDGAQWPYQVIRVNEPPPPRSGHGRCLYLAQNHDRRCALHFREHHRNGRLVGR